MEFGECNLVKEMLEMSENNVKVTGMAMIHGESFRSAFGNAIVGGMAVATSLLVGRTKEWAKNRTNKRCSFTNIGAVRNSGLGIGKKLGSNQK